MPPRTQGEQIAVITEILTRLEHKLDGLVQDRETDREESRVSRENILRRLDAVEQDIRAIKPAAEDYGRMRQRAGGAVVTLSLIGGAIGAVLALMKDRILTSMGW